MKASTLIKIADDLCTELHDLPIAPPVTHVYNPLEYARKPHDEYMRRYGKPPKEVVLVGMNPGPWGMAQTGVPFGEVEAARDFLGIRQQVHKPSQEHPKRPVEGFNCPRSEVSGKRLWGWAADRFGAAEKFFERFFVTNYCPLTFMEASARNRTPDKLPAAQRDRLYAACDIALRKTMEHLRPSFVIGIGAFATQRAHAALQGMNVTIGRILHPSPASPLANRGWAAQATKQLQELGVTL